MGTILAVLGLVVAFYGLVFATIAYIEVHTFAESVHKNHLN